MLSTPDFTLHKCFSPYSSCKTTANKTLHLIRYINNYTMLKNKTPTESPGFGFSYNKFSCGFFTQSL